MKKWISVALSAMLTLSLAAGCGTQADSSGDKGDSSQAQAGQEIQSPKVQSDGEKKEINITWTNIKESQQQVWQDYVIKPFEEKHPDVKVNFQGIPDLQNTIRVQIGAGAGPDMFYMDSIDIPDFASTGHLLNIEPYREQYGMDDFMFDWAIDSTEYKGEMYALPHSVEATAMTYNKTLLDQLGKDVPKTRQEFVDICDAALAAGLIPVSFGYSGENILLTWPYEHYITCYAGGEKTAQLLKGEIGFDDPDIKGAFALLKADWDAGYINDKKSGAIKNDEARTLFTNQKAVFNFEGPWLTLVDTPPGTWEFEWGQCAWPSMKDGMPAASAITLGEAIGINADTKYPDLCVELMMDFYMNEEKCAQAVAAGFSTPARSIDASNYPEDMPDQIRTTLDVQDQNMNAESVGYAPWGFYPSKTAWFLNDNLDKVFYDQMDLDTFLLKAQECLEQDLADGYVFAG